MAYLGNTALTQNFASGTDYFSGNGSTTSFTLSRSVASANDIVVVVENVVQNPSTAYTISGSGSTITFTSAPPSGSSNVYVRYMSTTTQVVTPAQNSVGLPQLNTDLQGATYSFKNRIINGDMRIDQRNAGGSVLISSSGLFSVDRFRSQVSQTSKITMQQNMNNVTPPAGFTNYLGISVTATATIGTNDNINIYHGIENLNTTDLSWGTSNASPVTLSFWVRSSVTGAFGGSLQNGPSTRSFPFSYTINSANTWEQKTITIPGDTAAYWSGQHTYLFFTLGCGSAYQGTANTWSQTSGAGTFAPTGNPTTFMGTAGATWYITGVQFEKGTTATQFDSLPYTTQLQLCQRYTYVIRGTDNYYARYPIFGNGANTAIWYPVYPVQMRTQPSLSAVNITNATVEGYNFSTGGATGTISNAVMAEGSVLMGQVTLTWASGIASGAVACWRFISNPNASWVFAAEL